MKSMKLYARVGSCQAPRSQALCRGPTEFGHAEHCGQLQGRQGPGEKWLNGTSMSHVPGEAAHPEIDRAWVRFRQC